MNNTNPPSNKNYFQNDYIQAWIETFINDRKMQNMSKRTLEFYQCKLKNLIDFCESKAV